MLKATSKNTFRLSNSKTPNKYANFVGRVTAEFLNVREWAGISHKTVSFSPLKRGEKVYVCDAILSPDNKTWYYINYGDKYGFVNADYVAKIPPLAIRCLSYLSTYNKYIKKNYRHFINKYEPSINTFEKAKEQVRKDKTVGITCVVPLRWALHEMGIKNASGQSLISAPDGSFEKYYTGDVKNHLVRIVKGGAIGFNIKDAIDRGLLVDGDIVCYKNITHTSVYSGTGYNFYEGGEACVKGGHYPNGILLDYSRNFYRNKKISEILRWKG